MSPSSVNGWGVRFPRTKGLYPISKKKLPPDVCVLRNLNEISAYVGSITNGYLPKFCGIRSRSSGVMGVLLRGAFPQTFSSLSGETICRMRISLEVQKQYGSLYHHAGFDGSGTSPPPFRGDPKVGILSVTFCSCSSMLTVFSFALRRKNLKKVSLLTIDCIN